MADEQVSSCDVTNTIGAFQAGSRWVLILYDGRLPISAAQKDGPASFTSYASSHEISIAAQEGAIRTAEAAAATAAEAIGGFERTAELERAQRAAAEDKLSVATAQLRALKDRLSASQKQADAQRATALRQAAGEKKALQVTQPQLANNCCSEAQR